MSHSSGLLTAMKRGFSAGGTVLRCLALKNICEKEFKVL